MNRTTSINLWRILGVFAILTGLFPLVYIFPESEAGLLSTKGELRHDPVWVTAFYLHISGGGLAMLTGWFQFWGRLRSERPTIHRRLGLIYWISILLISGPASVYLGIHANGGFAGQAGFTILGIMWLLTTFMAIRAIRNKEIRSHRDWMTRSYALTLAAFTLRLYMPVLIGVFGLTFDEAYVGVSWLCWVPNLILSEWIIGSRNNSL